MEVPFKKLYKKMFLIRKFEEMLLNLFSEGKLFGTTHTYIGQEAIAVTVMEHLFSNDVVFSNHRCHGHFLAKENDPEGLLAEIMGREKGVCGGRGGSHLGERTEQLVEQPGFFHAWSRPVFCRFPLWWFLRLRGK